jgi:spermidine/putrescine transport system substrate-binding protein
MKRSFELLAVGLVALGLAGSAFAQDNKLRLITWADYVPADMLRSSRRKPGSTSRSRSRTTRR